MYASTLSHRRHRVKLACFFETLPKWTLFRVCLSLIVCLEHELVACRLVRRISVVKFTCCCAMAHVELNFFYHRLATKLRCCRHSLRCSLIFQIFEVALLDLLGLDSCITRHSSLFAILLESIKTNDKSNLIIDALFIFVTFLFLLVMFICTSFLITHCSNRPKLRILLQTTADLIRRT